MFVASVLYVYDSCSQIRLWQVYGYTIQRVVYPDHFVFREHNAEHSNILLYNIQMRVSILPITVLQVVPGRVFVAG